MGGRGVIGEWEAKLKREEGEEGEIRSENEAKNHS